MAWSTTSTPASRTRTTPTCWPAPWPSSAATWPDATLLDAPPSTPSTPSTHRSESPLTTPTDQPPENRPLACDLTAIPPARRADHQALITRLFGAAAEERHDLPDGYAWRFAGDHYPEVAAFIDNERRCCPFLTFSLTVAPDGGPVWLRLTGGAEIKRFLQAELGL